MDEQIVFDVEGSGRGIFGKIVKLVLLALVIAAIVTVVKKAMGGKGQMTEADVRDKFDKASSRMGEERTEAVADKVVDKMRSTGMLLEEAADQVEAAAEAADEAADES